MNNRLLLDSGTVDLAATHFKMAASVLADAKPSHVQPFLGAATVAAALAQTTRIRAAQVEALTEAMSSSEAAVRQGVLDMLAADRAAAAKAGG